MSNEWDQFPAATPMDVALHAEGVSGKTADVARSIYTQESSSGKNTKTSNAGAVGGMQILPGTFKEVADAGWDINNPEHNARAGVRYVKQMSELAGGDPALTAAGYYGGRGGLEKARKGVAVSDPRNPNAPNTLQYGQQVAARVKPGITAPASVAAASENWDQFPLVEDPAAVPTKEKPGLITSAAAGIGSGVGKVAMGAQHYIGKGLSAVGADEAGQWLVDDAAAGRAKLAGEVAPYKAANPVTTGAGEFGGEIMATLPVGGLLGSAAKAAGATRLGTAIGSSGMTTGAKVAPGLAPAAGDLALRMAGGAVTGGATVGMIDPSSAGTGAAIGAALPAGLKVAGMGANAVAASVRPFLAKGQDKIAGDTLREFAANPKNALTQLLQSGETIPGSMPTTAMAAGDDGIAALSRALQNADPRYASDLAARTTAQNQARTAALESMAGNTGKLDIAKTARDKLTSPMREGVLDSAGRVPSEGVLSSIDSLIARPDNAGKLAQQALNEFRGRIAQFSKDGAIDSRALYAIRKDINEVLGGKLQGEAGNLRHASGQLIGVKGIIDDAIDLASRRVAGQPAGSALMPHGANMSANTIPAAPTAARPSWADYLQAYTKESIPIRQMEKLDKIMKSVQTGSVDSQGGLIISSAQLNNVLKNQGDDLVKLLDPKQLDLLRRVSADLNASQIASTTGRSGGSTTVQNLAQNQLLTGVLGRTLGGSTPATAMLGRLLQLPYGTASKQIQERLGNAMLDPKEAARLLADPKSSALVQALQPSRAGPGGTGILPNAARSVSAGLGNSSVQGAEAPARINVQAPANPTAPAVMPGQQDPSAYMAETEQGMQTPDVQPEAGEQGAAAMPAQDDASPLISSSMRPDGTLAISGDPQDLHATLVAAGIPARSIMRNKSGVMVGKSQAGAVREAIARLQQPDPASAPASATPAESVGMSAENQQMTVAGAEQLEAGQAAPLMGGGERSAFTPDGRMEPAMDNAAPTAAAGVPLEVQTSHAATDFVAPAAPNTDQAVAQALAQASNKPRTEKEARAQRAQLQGLAAPAIAEVTAPRTEKEARAQRLKFKIDQMLKHARDGSMHAMV